MEPVSPYDALLARHLVSVLSARLFVGDDLKSANWNGIEEAFGELLVLVPHESILAVYDDSLFGRGAKGFVVTDRHLAVVTAGNHRVSTAPGNHLVALVDIAAVKSSRDWLILTVSDLNVTKPIGVRVDEPLAHATVLAWMRAVVERNAPRFQQAERERAQKQQEAAKQRRAQQIEEAEEDRKLSARKALRRLEKLIERKRLGIDERAWLIRLAEQAQALEEARAGKGKERS